MHSIYNIPQNTDNLVVISSGVTIKWIWYKLQGLISNVGLPVDINWQRHVCIMNTLSFYFE